MLSRFRFLGAFAATLLLFQSPAGAARAATPTTPPAATPPVAEDAVAFVSNLADEALDVLGAKEMPEHRRLATFEKLLRNEFDLRFIGRVALGRHWKRATREQKAEYIELFEAHVLQTYTALLSTYSSEKIQIGKARPAGKRDLWVDSTILRTSGPTVKVGWRVRQVKDRLRVIDVKVEGISMVQTQRDEFSTVVQNNGVDGLLDMLRIKVRGQPTPA